MDIAFFKPWILFWVFVVFCHVYFDYALYRRWKGWSRGTRKKFTISGSRGSVLKILLAEVFLQRQLFSLSVSRWMLHQCIFWGFGALAALSMGKFIVLLLSKVSLDGGLYDMLTSGAGYHFTKLWGDLFGLLLLAGCSGALARRLVFRPVQLVHDQADIFLLVYLLLMTVSGFVLEGLRLSVSSPDAASYAFIGRMFMPSRLGVLPAPGMLLPVTWIVHGFSGVAVLIYLPHSKLVHSFLAPLVIAMNAAEENRRKDMYWPPTKQYRPTK